MRKIAMGLQKVLLVAAVAALGVVSVPAGSAAALAAADATPVAPTIGNVRIELAWARLQAAHARLQVVFDFANQRFARVQQLIDRAKANGKDVAAVQSALDSLKTAVQQARPIFESTNGLIASHPGFDASGNVTDSTMARQTVQDLVTKYRDIGSIVKPATEAFRQAIQDFRQTNGPTPTPGA